MLNPYLRFYWLALKEYLPERRRKLLRIIWLVLAFILGWIVADIFGIPLIRPLKWTYHLMPGSYWAIAGLLCFVVFQCFVIEGARRYHERIVAGLEKQHGSELVTLKTQREADLLDSDRRAGIVGVLSNRVAMIEEHFACHRELQQPLDKEFVESWLNGVADDIRMRLGRDAVKKFFDGSDTGEPAPDAPQGQVPWMRKYTQKLNIIISEQYPQPSNPVLDPVTKEEEEAREKLRESVRAWVKPKRS